MSLLIPKENLQMCSRNVSEQVNYLVSEGMHNPMRAADMARRAILHFAPDLMSFIGKRVKVESSNVFLLDEESVEGHYDEGSFQARLSRMSVERITSTDSLEGLVTDLEVENCDIALTFKPEFTDPDPIDLVFGRQIIVPLGDVERLELPLNSN